MVFFDMTPWCLINTETPAASVFILEYSSILKKGLADFSRRLESIYQTTRRQILEDHNLDTAVRKITIKCKSLSIWRQSNRPILRTFKHVAVNWQYMKSFYSKSSPKNAYKEITITRVYEWLTFINIKASI
jgi:hypothetical protein